MNVLHSTTPKSERRTDLNLTQQWNSIDWKIVRATVNRLQTRIAKAVFEGKYSLAKRIQYLLTHSYSAKLLVVRIVTKAVARETPVSTANFGLLRKIRCWQH